MLITIAREVTRLIVQMLPGATEHCDPGVRDIEKIGVGPTVHLLFSIEIRGFCGLWEFNCSVYFECKSSSIQGLKMSMNVVFTLFGYSTAIKRDHFGFTKGSARSAV